MFIPNALFPLLTTALSPGGNHARLTILMYHRVLDRFDPLSPYTPTADVFDCHMQTLANGFNVLPLSEAIERLQKKSLPRRAACVTFDDGYRDNYTVAAPVLRRYGLPATIFVSTGFLDGGRMWNDSVIEAVRRATGPSIDARGIGLGEYAVANDAEKAAAMLKLLDQLKYLPFAERAEKVAALCESLSVTLPNDLMLSTAEARAARQTNIEIGAHTVHHPILTQIDDEHARREIADSKKHLEEILREKITLFAYPNGRPNQDYLVRHAAMVKQAGFVAAVSTASGTVNNGSDLFQLPRYAPWDKLKLRLQLRLLQNLLRPAPNPAYA
jgi:peptidoglycan/xylan/chitin deacetylase (PgdA/CDA1 family)